MLLTFPKFYEYLKINIKTYLERYLMFIIKNYYLKYN